MKFKGQHRLFVYFSIASVSILGLSSSSHNTKKYECKKGHFTYMVSDYLELSDKKIGGQLNEILQIPIYNCFCKNKIQNLPTKDGYKDYKKYDGEVTIEPFFINLINSEGLYGKYTYYPEGPKPHFRCGVYHYLFLISDNHYYQLTDDSIKNVSLVKNKLSKSFSDNEIQRIIKWDVSNDIICTPSELIGPFLIKKDAEIIWEYTKWENTENE